VNGTTRLVRRVDGKRVAGTGAGIGLKLSGALGPLLSLAWGPLNAARRHRDSHHSYDGGAPALVRAEKRLYQDPGRQPLAGEGRVYQGKPL
jgi:hypothetical protein